ncbi:hypothetical protein GWI33_006912 [Rhynchophorus ferrugineus]|uniref:Uncharacterized protein n=1 Tax=Rhynchophorus ferrugineus TaxID=354439 RepID=A0A834IRZ1_RHYFE|nr:hypothetical protein GWI33_006912 [Rhynchophorus ferrugineus]
MNKYPVVSVFLVCASFLQQRANADIPSYLKVCKRGPDFTKCAIANGNAALPEILKGNKKFNIPNMLPLTFPVINAQAGSSLKIKFIDLKVIGLETVKLVDISVDFDKHSIYLIVHADKITLDGSYEVDGKIMVLAVQGKGTCKIDIENGTFRYSFTYRIEEIDGVEYGRMDPNDKLEFNIEKAHFNFDNLFNGNKEMGDNVNKFLNENSQDIIRELTDTIDKTISSIARQVGGGVVENIPYKELFIE